MSKLSLDINRTKAILIGICNYKHMSPVEPAVKNIDDMVQALINSQILGVASENIFKIIDKENDVIHDELINFIKDEKNIGLDTLIFYYVGHGVREINSKELYITGVNSKNHTITSSGLRYNEVKRILENSHIQNRIIFIDSCHSGLATLGSESPFTENEIDIKGSYTLTAAAADEKAAFNTCDRNTFFTADLLNIMKNGLSTNKESISLDDIYLSLQKTLNKSTPQRKDNLNVINFNLFKNIQFDSLLNLEQEGDLLFSEKRLEEAKIKYLEVHLKKRSKRIRDKIDKCNEYIRLLASWTNMEGASLIKSSSIQAPISTQMKEQTQECGRMQAGNIRETTTRQKPDLRKMDASKTEIVAECNDIPMHDVRKLKKLIQDSVEYIIWPNDPCPCGSGKKYKSCHGGSQV